VSVIRYVCEGNCHGKVTEDEHKSGKTKCGLKSCENYGQLLVRKEYCSGCNTVFDEGDHVCMA